MRFPLRFGNFTWEAGRNKTGYLKMLVIETKAPGFDCYLIRYPEGSANPPHKDRLGQARHYRLNIVLWNCSEGGAFQCPVYKSWLFGRIIFFCPSEQLHSVTPITKGTRLVLSFGWLRGDIFPVL